MQVNTAARARMTEGPADWFTGRVWIERISEPDYASLRASRVYFSAGARTAWHTHPRGQSLHIVEGVARVQSDGEEVRELYPGDTVSFEPGERHWHGATSGRPMVHIALQDAASDGSTAAWGEHVSDVEFLGAPAETTRDELLTARLGAQEIDRVKLVRITLPAGQRTGRHTHPCPVAGLVLSGEIQFAIAREPVVRLTAGDAFHEPVGAEVVQFDNASDTDSAVFLACYLLPPGVERLIEMLD